MVELHDTVLRSIHGWVPSARDCYLAGRLTSSSIYFHRPRHYVSYRPGGLGCRRFEKKAHLWHKLRRYGKTSYRNRV